MLVIFGTNVRYTDPIHDNFLNNACPKCGSNMKKKEAKTWFTLFFIPLIPVKTHEPVYKCERCIATVYM